VFDNEHSLHLWKRHLCTLTVWRQLTGASRLQRDLRGLLYSHRYIVFINPIELYWIATIRNKKLRLRDFSISLYKIEILCAWPTARERIYRFVPNLACLFLQTSKRTEKGQNSEKLSWVRVPLRVVPVPRKLSTTEERLQDQSCLTRRGDYRTKAISSKISSGFESRWRFWV
jgi:hypothetical protein